MTAHKDFIEKFKEDYDIGFPTFKKLFDLKKEDLIEKLKDLCGDKVPESIFEGSVYKEIKDDLETKIEVCFYDTLYINALGISFTPEHGQNRKVVEFNKFFVLV